MASIIIVYGPNHAGKHRVARSLGRSAERLVPDWDGSPLERGDVAVTELAKPPLIDGAIYVRVGAHG